MSVTTLPRVPLNLSARRVVLRPYRKDDADFVRDVYVAVRWHETESWPVDFRLTFLYDQHRLQDAHYHAYYVGAAWGIIEVASERAGRLYLHRSDGDLRLIDIALLPSYRSQGIGSGLIEAVKDEARELNLTTVSLHVEQYNPAAALYERLGFRKAALRGIYQLMEWPVT